MADDDSMSNNNHNHKKFSSDRLNKLREQHNKKIKLLISLAVIGLVLFSIGSAALPFKDKILDTFYPKKQSKAAEAQVNPQYIVIYKSPTGGTDGCYNPSPSQSPCYPYYWIQSTPASITAAGLDEIIDAVNTKGTVNRRLAFGYTINYFATDTATNSNLAIQALNNLLGIAKQKQLPVVINLDGWQFRMGRPDLWKWWDPGISAEESKQRKDAVEWTGWDNSSAIKLSWEQFDFTKPEYFMPPQPNLANRGVIEANKEQLQVLVPIIVNWYNSLPDDQKYLLAGVKLGWEVRAVNSYYRNTGLEFVKQEYDADPQGTPIPRGNPIQTGYAGVKTAGIKSSGNITSEDLNTVMQRYFEELAKLTVDLGIPRGKVFTHGFAPEFERLSTGLAYNTAQGAVVPHAQPGWSIYNYSKDVKSAYGIDSSLDLIGNAPWAASEWLCTGSNVTAPCSRDQWINAINNTFNYRNNRWINVYGWEGIKNLPEEPVNYKKEAIEGIRESLQPTAAPSCLVDQPVLNSPVINGQSVTLSWTPGQDNQKLSLFISNSSEISYGGLLKNPNQMNGPVTGNSYQKNLSPGTYYWQVIADGCTPTTPTQRIVSETKSFTIDSSGACTVTPVTNPGVVINPGRVSFIWNNGQNNDKNSIYYLPTANVIELKMHMLRTSGNADVTGRTSYDISLPPNKTYSWGIVSTGCGGTQRQISQLHTFPTQPATDFYTPLGVVEYSSDCSTIKGWVCDQDSNDSQLQVIFNASGFDKAIGWVKADSAAVHPEQAVKDVCMDSNGRPSTAAHGYTFTIPGKLKDGKAREIRAYSQNIDSAGKESTISVQSKFPYKPLPGNPVTINCAVPVSPAPTTNKININTSINVQDKVQAY